MLKPDSLRKAIVAAIPDLRKKPDDLAIYVRKGQIVSRDGPALGFQYRYTVLVELMDFAGNPDALFVAILLWVRRYQPDLVQKMDDRAGFRFDADRLSPTAVDIVVELDLDESVATAPRQGGGVDLVHVLERPPLNEIWLGDRRLVPDPATEVD
jgi:hypothetical protein